MKSTHNTESKSDMKSQSGMKSYVTLADCTVNFLRRDVRYHVFASQRV
ncbi:MAG TPA: hypothetical protein V6C71_08850 [Coleofasciculaceae cyanobacterium]